MNKTRPGINADAFWLLASGYRDAGDAVLKLVKSATEHDGEPAFMLAESGAYRGYALFPCIFLYFHSIELSLKAALVANGISEDQIVRQMGHRISDLVRCVEQSTQLPALGITPQDRILLDRFSADYANKWFEYADDLWSKERPSPDELKSLTHRVGERVVAYLKAKEETDTGSVAVV